MTFAPSVEVQYHDSPTVLVRIESEDTDRSFQIEAIVDTGADVTILDESVAIELGVVEYAATDVQIRGIGGRVEVLSAAPVTIRLVAEPEISGIVRAVFVHNAHASVGNLIGLDFLESVDFGLSHGERVAYFGLPG